MAERGLDQRVIDALDRHRADVVDVLQRRDPGEVKALYKQLGVLLEDAAAGDAAAAPLLSLPGTSLEACRLLAGVTGLLIDGGCGPNPAASVALALADARRTIVALDLGEGTVRLARAVARRSGVDVLGVVADVEALPFRNGAFDGGVCDDTVEHLPDDVQGAAELARVTRTGGRMVIATPNRRSIQVLVRKLRDRAARRARPAAAYYAAESHLREYTWSDLARLLHPSFTIVARGNVGWEGGCQMRLASNLTQRGPFRRLSRMVIVAAAPRRQQRQR